MKCPKSAHPDKNYCLGSNLKQNRVGVEAELSLTPLRACWLWNAADIDLNQLNVKFKTFKTR